LVVLLSWQLLVTFVIVGTSDGCIGDTDILLSIAVLLYQRLLLQVTLLVLLILDHF
jgi:hypothetical protein